MSVDLNALRKTAHGLRTSRDKGIYEQLKAKTNKYENYLRDLREDSNTIRDALKENILTFVANKLSVSLDPDEDKEYMLWDQQLMTRIVKTRTFTINGQKRPYWSRERIGSHLPLKLKIKPSTYFTGYWDPKTRSHRCDDWKNAGIGLMVKELNKVLSPITLEDISDRSKSTCRVYLCKVPSSKCKADEQDADECKADEQKADEQDADEHPVPAARGQTINGQRDAAPPQAAVSTVTVTVPAGASASDQLSIQLPGGSEVTITLPQGWRPGYVLEWKSDGSNLSGKP